MNFTVRWDPPTLSEFYEHWAVASDPAAVRAARETIERLLGEDPHRHGQHLSEGLWRLVVPPLVVHYTTDPDRRVVEITDVARTA